MKTVPDTLSYTYEWQKPTLWAIVDLVTWVIQSTDWLSRSEQEKLTSRVHTPTDPYPVSYPEVYTEIFSLPWICEEECFRILNEYISPITIKVAASDMISDEIVQKTSAISAMFVNSLSYETHPLLQRISSDLAHPYRYETVFQTWIPEHEKVMQWFLFNFWVQLSAELCDKISWLCSDPASVRSQLIWKTFQFVTPLHGHPSSLLIDHAIPSDDVDENLAVQVEYEIYTSDQKMLVTCDSQVIDDEFEFTKEYPYRLVWRDMLVFKKDEWLWLQTDWKLDGLCNPHSILPLRDQYATLNTYLGYGDVSSFSWSTVSVELSDQDATDLQKLLTWASETLLIDTMSPFTSVSPEILLNKFVSEIVPLSPHRSVLPWLHKNIAQKNS